MRLSLSEVEAIIRCKNKIFGEASKIFLFGSRVDDALKGGDIDLYIEAAERKNLVEKKISFLTLLEELIGEQKIDVVFKTESSKLVEVEAQEKGVELNLRKIKLAKYFNECDKHIQRIEEAYADLIETVPLNADQYEHLTKDEVQALDQYIFRFSKLQDTMGEKIFRLVLEQYELDTGVSPFIDVLNKLEKYGCISSAKEWMGLRKLRNEIAHQYDDEPEEMSQAINALVNQKSIIIEVYLKVKNCHAKNK